MSARESCRRALRLLARGEWMTAAEIAAGLGMTTAGATARVRDLRKPAFGSHAVECRFIAGAHRYRIIPRELRATAGG